MTVVHFKLQPGWTSDTLQVLMLSFCHILHGCRKNSLIKQFLKDVHWGALDYLVVDAPPGTSDEHISIAQFLQADPVADGAVIVTTPQVCYKEPMPLPVHQ